MSDAIAWLSPGSGLPGRVAFMGFPGLTILSRGNLFVDPDAQDAVVASLAAEGCALFVILADRAEVLDGEFEALADTLRAAEIPVIYLPIEDFGVPDAAALEHLQALRPRIRAVLEQGGSVAVSCLAGFGRSGMIAAQILIDCGHTPATAIAAVRTARPGAIESARQMQFLTVQERVEP